MTLVKKASVPQDFVADYRLPSMTTWFQRPHKNVEVVRVYVVSCFLSFRSCSVLKAATFFSNLACRETFDLKRSETGTFRLDVVMVISYGWIGKREKGRRG